MKRAILAALAVPLALVGVAGMGASVSTSTSAFGPSDEASADRAQRLAAQLVRERRADAAQDARFRRALAAERRLGHLVRNPSPANNRALAHMLLRPSEAAAVDKIAAGESSYIHDVWNGGARGAYPDRTSGRSGATCAVGDAYGIGQACPRSKMEKWAGTPAVYEIASLQLWWMRSYAQGRYGSLEAAGAHWTAGSSW